MAGPIAQAGATSEPSEYASLSMDTQFTGEWTQRNPLRDAAVPYLYRKFYSASRFDSIIDGINREITSSLTDKRRPGTSIYNSNTFPPANSIGTFKWSQSGTGQQVRVIYDGQDGTIYDATAGQKSSLFTKSAGAGKARFLGVGPTLFFGDGVDQAKILRSSLAWKANTAFNPGNYIIDSNGNVQAVELLSPATISTIQVANYGIVHVPPITVWYIKIVFTTQPTWAPYTYVAFNGVTTYGAVNGKILQVLPFSSHLPAGGNAMYFTAIINTAYGPTADTGTGAPTTFSGAAGTSGATRPTWATGLGASTADGSLTWECFGPPAFNWQIAAPTSAPVVTPDPAVRLWQPGTAFSLWYSLLDNNGNVQVAINSTGSYVTGGAYPNFAASIPSASVGAVGTQPQTADGTIVWQNCGAPLGWFGTTKFYTYQCVLDSNQNLQVLTVGGGGASGGSAPAWATTIGATTTDGALTWTCVGPGVVLLTGAVSYGYAYHSIDGSLTAVSPLTPFNVNGAVLGAANAYTAAVSGPNTTDAQCDQIFLYKTPSGQAVPLLMQQIPNPSVGTAATWAITDTIPQTALFITVSAPQNGLGTPPPAGATGPELHCGRIWVFVGSVLYYSDGAAVNIANQGNGNTSFSPLNNYQLPEQITRIKSVTVQGGGLLVICASNTYIVMGNGTSTSPFVAPKIYMDRVGVMSYDECAFVGSTMYAFSNTSKAFSFDPSNGYTEIGFPIGDQFQTVTTGGINAALYTPGSTFVTWHEKFSGDTGLMFSDGAVGWFRYSPIAAPESGSLWSPRAAITGGTSAVQSVETATGVWNLLIAPRGGTTGPILMRDTTQAGDWSAGAQVPFPSWDVKGSIGLCDTGEVAEIAHICLVSQARGARPIVSLLLDEIIAGFTAPGQETTAWDQLSLAPGHHEDPPNLAPSISMYSDRYTTSSAAETPKCKNFQLKIDYGAQLFQDELLSFGVFGAVRKERIANQ